MRLQHARTWLGKSGYQDVLLLLVHLVVAQTAVELRISGTSFLLEYFRHYFLGFSQVLEGGQGVVEFRVW